LLLLVDIAIISTLSVGANPTDRSKSGTKRSMMVVEGKGVPLGITVDAANRHDIKMTKTTLQSIDSSS
jgi:putative transposase